MLSHLSVLPELQSQILESQQSDAELLKLLGKSDFHQETNEAMLFKGQLCIPSDAALKDRVMTKAHKYKFSIHPGSTKMYQDLKRNY